MNQSSRAFDVLQGNKFIQQLLQFSAAADSEVAISIELL
jgi:hypothetical protein